MKEENPILTDVDNNFISWKECKLLVPRPCQNMTAFDQLI